MENLHINVSGINLNPLSLEPGNRLTVFLQGCQHNCPGCQSPHTQPMEGGIQYTVEEVMDHYGMQEGLEGISFSGGEPFLQAAGLAQVAREVHKQGHSVITYTGFPYESLQAMAQNDPATKDLLDETDLLVDSAFLLEEQSADQPVRSSKNQRYFALTEVGRNLESKIKEKATESK